MKSSKLAWVGVLAAFGAWLGCGGNVVVDPANPGSGGSGGSGSTTLTSTMGSGTSTTSNGTGGVGGACALGVPDPNDCFTACSAVYDCGTLQCNGAKLCVFTGDPADKAAFMGNDVSGCIGGCKANTALVNLVDPSDCITTISVLKDVSPDFAAACGNTGPACISCSEALVDNVSEICKESASLYSAWVNCACDGNCEFACGESLCSGNEWTPECQSCMMDPDPFTGCGQELNACLNNT